MLIAFIVAFFVDQSFLLSASITVTVAWMAFLKTKAEESEAALGDLEGGDNPEIAADGEDSHLFRSERLSTFNFWNALLTYFDFIEIMEARIAQAELDWS